MIIEERLADIERRLDAVEATIAELTAPEAEALPSDPFYRSILEHTHARNMRERDAIRKAHEEARGRDDEKKS